MILGTGFLGTYLIEFFSKKYETIGGDLNPNNSKILKVDATDSHGVEKFILKNSPDLVVDTIALTSSIECEKNPEKANELNHLTAKNIALACKKINSKMIFISSSYVFDGERGNYSERDEISPTGIYAKTKSLAEKEVLKIGKNLILRFDLMYGFNSFGKPNGIFDKVLSGKDFFLGNPNQIRSPLFIEDIPPAIEILFKKKEEGIFHLAGSEKIRMKEFIEKLENLIRKESKIKIYENKKLLVPEKKDSSLAIEKSRILGIQTSGIDKGLTKIIKKFRHL